MRHAMYAFLIAMFLFPAGVAASSVPHVIDFVVDPAVRQHFADEKALRRYIAGVVGQASLLFHADIGRRLEVGRITFGAPNIRSTPETVVLPELFLKWLKARDNGESRFLVFLTAIPFFDRDHGFLGGHTEEAGRRILLEYRFEASQVVFMLLHEIGHACGAGHQEKGLMAPARNSAITYGAAASAIREQCG